MGGFIQRYMMLLPSMVGEMPRRVKLRAEREGLQVMKRMQGRSAVS
jgi:hypothetical protein